MVDLDKDGKQDLIVADLGDFLPGDHEKGSVVWLRQTGPLQFEKIPLVTRLARTADVQAADFDGDSDLDLVVAAFGWHTVGGVFVYENKTTDWKQPKFEGYPVDARPGGIHVPIVDLDGDGKPDFVALVSQQYEHVVAYINRGAGKGFRPETLFRAVTPVWGSSGIQLVDLDKDGDLDLLMTNGDSLDDFTVRPFHGVRWFENEGSYPWKQHDLAVMPGVHRAQAADIDGDGDLDVLLTAVGDRPRLLRNDQKLGHHWLRVKLNGIGKNRDAIGAVVELQDNQTVQRRIISPTRSYLSQCELPATFGLGASTTAKRVVVRWPSGKTTARENVPADQLLVIKEDQE
jgi:hypothetical protein